MSAASARQSQRVLIDVPVRITLREAARTLPARALDLSEGGMRLQADAMFRVGDEVTCDLELDDEHAALHGIVRWCKPGLAQLGTGAGVQFEELSDAQLGLLRRWLLHNNEHAELVLLHLPGISEPLRARGCIGAEGLQVVASLPQLTKGAELEFQLGEHGSRRIGRVEHVAVKAASERNSLELAVRLQPIAAGRSRRNLVYGLGATDSIDLPDSLPPPARVPTFGDVGTTEESGVHLARRKAATKDTIEIPKTTTSRLIVGSLMVLLATGVSVLISNSVRGPSQPAPSKQSAKLKQEAVVAPKIAAPVAAVEKNREPATATMAATANTEAPRDALAPHPSPAPPSTQPTPASAPQSEGVVTDEAKLPALNSFGTTSEIFVPMQGTLNGLRSTQWTEPLAVVLDLPNAHIDAPELLQGLSGGGVRRVRLDETRPVPRLQIYLNTVAARFAARAVPHGLLVVLEHDLRPMPH